LYCSGFVVLGVGGGVQFRLGFTLFILPCYRMAVTRLTTAVTASGILSITFPS